MHSLAAEFVHDKPDNRLIPGDPAFQRREDYDMTITLGSRAAST